MSKLYAIYDVKSQTMGASVYTDLTTAYNVVKNYIAPHEHFQIVEWNPIADVTMEVISRPAVTILPNQK